MRAPLPPLHILFEDNHCLAIDKPAGTLTTGYEGGEETLDRQVKQYIKEKHNKPGNVFLGVVHRLDRPVSGVLLYARNSKSAGRLAEQFREGRVEKVYWAVVVGDFPMASGTLEDWLRKDRLIGRVEIQPPQTEGAKLAVLLFQRLGGNGKATLLEIRPRTGRTHQIRVQLAHRGHPIYGDHKYGSAHDFKNGIALHARSLTFLHPIRFEPITLTAELPTAWRQFTDMLPPPSPGPGPGLGCGQGST